MVMTFRAAVESYLRAKSLARGTRNEYFSTLRKWEEWGAGLPIEDLRRRNVREFLDWVYERAKQIRITDPEQRREVLEYHRKAREFWKGIVDKANAD